MSSTITPLTADDHAVFLRADELFRENKSDLFRRTDRLFAGLMVLQWFAGVFAAIWISPRTWAGAYSETHLHVWAAVLLGGLISAFPICLALGRPGSTLTRHVIAVSQMLTSALLIHLSGGRIETHFHIFGSLAFLACYRDWRVLITATLVVAADHFIRGIYFPLSVFGIAWASTWRVFEHAAWVVFEDIFLLITIKQSIQEMKAMARQRAELEATNEQVLETKERFRSILENVVDSVITIGETGTIEEFNTAAEKMFGYRTEEVLGKNVTLLMPSPFREEHDGYLSRYLTTSKRNIIGMDREVIGMRKDGTTFPINLSVSEVLLHTSEASEQPLRLFTGIIRDLSEVKENVELKQAIQKAEKLSAFGRILDRSLNEIYIFDLDSLHFVHVNHGARENIGYTIEELQRLTPLHIKPEHTPESFAELVAPLLDGTQDNIDFRTVHRRKDGSEYPVEVHLETSTLGERSVFTAVILDITEQNRAAEQIMGLARFPDENSNPVLRSTADGILSYSNAAGVPLLEEWRTQVGDSLPAGIRTTVQEALESGETVGLELTADDQWYALKVTPVPQENYVNLYGTNTTSRKQLNADLIHAKESAEAANRAKSEFLANVSHEIRTPMTAILGFTDVLLENVVKPENIESVRIVKENGEYLIHLINNILDISKIEANKCEVERLECSPHQIITEVASLMQVRATTKNLPLKVRLDGAIPETIHSDPTRLRQILINIVGNAIKFTETGAVEIVTRLLNEQGEEPKLQFDVIDTGIGIAEDYVEKLFLPFTQADNSTTRQFGGTGLGLTISKRLVELLDGKMFVSSTPDQGTTFSFTISTGPLDGVKFLDGFPESARETKPNRIEDLNVSPLNCHILLAEDTAFNQKLISLLLKKAGAKVTLADNGQIAFDLAMAAREENQPFDIILMDMQMPVLDGYAATARLREVGYIKPIIALTAHAMTSDRQRCLDAGCDDYTTKPVNKKELIEMVASYTEQTKVTAQLSPSGAGDDIQWS